MIHGVKYDSKDILYLRKPHFCPDCKTKLKTVKVSKVVNWKSPEAKDYDFSSVDTYLVGNIKFVWKEFECPSCNRHITVKEMKKLEGVYKERAGSGIGGKIAFVICAVLFFVIIALANKYF